MELTEYWKIIRAHWVALIVFTSVGALLGLGWAALQPKVYISNASGVIQAGANTDVGSAIAGDNLARSLVKSYADVATSRSVAEVAAETTGFTGDPSTLLSRISVTNPLDTATLKVSVRGASPEEARDLAEAWVQAVGTQINKLQDSSTMPGTGSSVVKFTSLDSAQLPTSPSSPNTRLALLIGLGIGLATGFAYALLRSIFDRRIQSISQVQAETGKPVIGTIPFHSRFTKDDRIVKSAGGNDRTSLSAEEYSVAEAVRELRTNLQYMNVDDPPRAIVITSSLPGEGKSTVTANLANAIAAGGQRVVVVDGDLRRPTVAKTFDVLPGIGLTDVLVGRADLDDVLQPWGDSGRLRILGAGHIPPNPSELLGSRAMERVLEELSRDAIVLIDAPPLLPVTDAAILAARTDGALVVTYAQRTTLDAVREALSNVERVHGKALGIIINGVPNRGSRAGGYGYRYRKYSYYGSDSSPAPRSPEANSTVEPSIEVAEPREQLSTPRRAAL